MEKHKQLIVPPNVEKDWDGLKSVSGPTLSNNNVTTNDMWVLNALNVSSPNWDILCKYKGSPRFQTQ